jgi:hypothetical protein
VRYASRVNPLRTSLALLVLSSALGCGSSSGDDASTAPDASATDGSTSDAAGDAGATADGAAHTDASLQDAQSSDSSSPADGGAAWWQPGTGVLPWQWEIDHEIVTTNAQDMGTGDTTYLNAAAASPVVYDIDAFDNSAADVTALHALGKKVICYMEVGAAESYRPDYAQFPTVDLGTAIDGYPQEKYLNINAAAVLTVIEARVAMCAQKGFDGIEPDIDDSYTDTTGFTITEADNVAYLTTLSAYAHSLGIAWGLKNGGDGGDPTSFVADVLPLIDFAVVEEPFFLTTIDYFEPTLYDAGKAMFVAEYTNDTNASSSFCSQAVADHTNAALFDVALDGMVRDPCQ